MPVLHGFTLLITGGDPVENAYFLEMVQNDPLIYILEQYKASFISAETNRRIGKTVKENKTHVYVYLPIRSHGFIAFDLPGLRADMREILPHKPDVPTDPWLTILHKTVHREVEPDPPSTDLENTHLDDEDQ